MSHMSKQVMHVTHIEQASEVPVIMRESNMCKAEDGMITVFGLAIRFNALTHFDTAFNIQIQDHCSHYHHY